MKSSGDQSQEFNTTLILAIVVAALLACGLLAIFYGCMKANNAPKTKAPTAQSQNIKGCVPNQANLFVPVNLR
jgi:flagellar basal body-associated protein FliL